MDPALKQRLVGAIVLVALAVIFLPMLIQGPAPESGAADVSLEVPARPGSDFETREIPLVSPGAAPEGGALGMDADAGNRVLPTVDTAVVDLDAAGAAAAANDPAAEAGPANEAAPPEDDSGMFPPPTAGGDYAVSFGSFSSAAAASEVVGQLRASQLPGYRERAEVDGWAVHRVRIGPYASRADAEAARLRAAHVRDDVGAQVVALDAHAGDTGDVAAAAPAKPAAPRPAAAPAAAADTGFAVQLGAFR
ncbi:MAG TPA: SPOR domain-containing protein, partial [Xanthomonadaceae bacterium]|nr:SPOR domain-containing protein [Xanthomonadaceae bacterium]